MVQNVMPAVNGYHPYLVLYLISTPANKNIIDSYVYVLIQFMCVYSMYFTFDSLKSIVQMNKTYLPICHSLCVLYTGMCIAVSFSRKHFAQI